MTGEAALGTADTTAPVPEGTVNLTPQLDGKKAKGIQTCEPKEYPTATFSSLFRSVLTHFLLIAWVQACAARCCLRGWL